MPRLSTDLIAQAFVLAKLDVGRPKQASVRRAVSTAYYGLFHFLIEESTLLVIGAAHSEAKNRQLAARAFSHTKMKTLCQEFTKIQSEQTNLLVRPLLKNADVVSKSAMASVAQTFIDLQDERHSADYNMSVSFSRNDATNAYQRAHDAVAAWNRLLRNDRNFCRFFAICLSFWPSLARR